MSVVSVFHAPIAWILRFPYASRNLGGVRKLTLWAFEDLHPRIDPMTHRILLGSVLAASLLLIGSDPVPAAKSAAKTPSKLFVTPGIKPVYREKVDLDKYLQPGDKAQRWTSKELPAILSAADVSRYRVIFRLQKEGEWKTADKIIRSLEDRILMGHVLAQRYLHPRKYRSKYTELKDWMDNYADHPEANRIYRLAFKRRPKNWKLPQEPTGDALGGSGHDGRRIGYLVYNPRKKLTKAEYREMRGYERRLRYYSRKGWTLAFKKLIAKKRVNQLLHPVQKDRHMAKLAAGYYAAGRDKWALDWAEKAAKKSGKYLPEAHWTAALASWRLKQYRRSRDHFHAVSQSDYTSAWLTTAGAFWAGRASIKIRRPQDFNKYMKQAAEHPRTFYGILAANLLDRNLDYDWTTPPLAQEAVAELSTEPGGRRAVTLLQIGEDRRAERELRLVFSSAKPELARAMLALADRANMPSLAMRLGNMLVQSGSEIHDSTAYPAPNLKTAGDESVDRELILAIVRQESGFNPKAKSHRGARGLMQLMPGTASFVARDRRFRGSKRSELFDPETNIALGQRYIDILLSDKRISGDLFRMVIAWNAGPGNLNKWTRKVNHDDDALLFIESIPARETRIFVERVLTNYWIYRARFRQPMNSLVAVAAGKWPVYHSERLNGVEVAEDGKEK